MPGPTYAQIHTDTALTNISIAYTNGLYIADQVFPNVPVAKISGKYFTYDKGDFLRREAQPRAPGTRAVRGDYGLSTSLYAALEVAIAKGVPDEMVRNADNPLQPYTDATNWVTEQLLLQKESDVAGLVFGNSVWSASANPAGGLTWDNDSSDPLGDIETGVNTVATTIGREPNVGVMGRSVWSKLRNHPDIVDRIKYGAGPGSPAVVTLQAVASLFGLDKLLIGRALENTAAESQTNVIAAIWGKLFWMGYVSDTPSLMTPSAGYVFTYLNREINRYTEDQEHQQVIEGRHSWDSAATATDAGYLIKAAVA